MSEKQQILAKQQILEKQTNRPYWILFYPLALMMNLGAIWGVFQDDGIFPRGTDAYHHLRRILHTLENYPHVPDFDPFINFPFGVQEFWPFGFDFIYATIIKIVTLGYWNQQRAIAIAVILTPMIWATVPCIVYLIAAKLGQIRAGYLAALILSLMHISYTSVGEIDHHVFEAFWVATYLLAHISMLKQISSAQKNFSRAIINALLTGIAITCGVLCATVLPLLVPAHLAIMIAQLIRNYKDTDQRAKILVLNNFIWLATIITLAPFVATRIAEPHGVNPALSLCWFAAFIFLIINLLFSLLHRDLLAPKNLITIIVLILLTGIIVIPRMEWQMVSNFIQYGLGHIYKADPWLASIQESQSPFKLGLRLILIVYAGFVFIWPIALIYLLWRGWRTSDGIWTVALFGLGATLPAIIQAKFVMFLITAYALGVGLFIAGIYEIASAKFNNQEIATNNQPVQRFRPIFIITVIVFIFGISPLLTEFTIAPVVVDSQGRFSALYPTLNWINAKTPPISANADQPDDYAMLVHWSIGHWIIYFTHKPIIASPLGHEQAQRAAVHLGTKMLMAEPQEAIKLMQDRRVRYVLISPLSLRDILKLSHWDEHKGQLDRPYDETKEINESLYIKLLYDGVPNGNEALRHFRLIHESPMGDDFPGLERPFAMLYERVPGALLTGKGAPNSNVHITAHINTSRSRDILYQDDIATDNDGNFSVRVPYGIGSGQYSDGGLAKPYVLENNGRVVGIAIGEQEVLTGAKREVVF